LVAKNNNNKSNQMKKLPLEEHIIGIAQILKVTEKEVMQVLFDAFKETSNA
jgi:hypothetical protein